MSKNTELLKQTFGHFCVDASCAAIVIHGTQSFWEATQFFVLYNFCAFCLQPLAGWIFDKVKRLRFQAYIITSLALLLIGFFPNLNVWMRVLLVGIGNCLFHVGAGTLVLESEKKKLAPLGIFVSSGAVGLFLGTIFAHTEAVSVFLILCLIGLILLNMELPERLKNHRGKDTQWGIVALLGLCIAIRSFMGFMPLTQFEKTTPILLMITLGVFIGKFLGGVLCDKFGIKKVVLVSTAVVIALFLFSFANPFLWTFVQMIVNLSMPITLYLMYRALPKYPGFSFGLAASCLVIGLLATLVVKDIDIPTYYFLFLFIINSGIILFVERKLK